MADEWFSPLDPAQGASSRDLFLSAKNESFVTMGPGNMVATGSHCGLRMHIRAGYIVVLFSKRAAPQKPRPILKPGTKSTFQRICTLFLRVNSFVIIGDSVILFAFKYNFIKESCQAERL